MQWKATAHPVSHLLLYLCSINKLRLHLWLNWSNPISQPALLCHLKGKKTPLTERSVASQEICGHDPLLRATSRFRFQRPGATAAALRRTASSRGGVDGRRRSARSPRSPELRRLSASVSGRRGRRPECATPGVTTPSPRAATRPRRDSAASGACALSRRRRDAPSSTPRCAPRRSGGGLAAR